jgi:hypothetical protein
MLLKHWGSFGLEIILNYQFLLDFRDWAVIQSHETQFRGVHLQRISNPSWCEVSSWEMFSRAVVINGTELLTSYLYPVPF